MKINHPLKTTHFITGFFVYLFENSSNYRVRTKKRNGHVHRRLRVSRTTGIETIIKPSDVLIEKQKNKNKFRNKENQYKPV